MGNFESRSAKYGDLYSAYGNIWLQVIHNEINSGGVISVYIYLELKSRFPGNEILLKLKGKEQTWKKRRKLGFCLPNSYVDKENTEENVFIKETIRVFTIKSSDCIIPGHYVFPAMCKLPNHLPGSFCFVQSPVRASIVYVLTACAKSSEMKLKHKRKIRIRQETDL